MSWCESLPSDEHANRGRRQRASFLSTHSPTSKKKEAYSPILNEESRSSGTLIDLTLTPHEQSSNKLALRLMCLSFSCLVSGGRCARYEHQRPMGVASCDDEGASKATAVPPLVYLHTSPGLHHPTPRRVRHGPDAHFHVVLHIPRNLSAFVPPFTNHLRTSPLSSIPQGRPPSSATPYLYPRAPILPHPPSPQCWSTTTQRSTTFA